MEELKKLQRTIKKSTNMNAACVTAYIPEDN